MTTSPIYKTMKKIFIIFSIALFLLLGFPSKSLAAVSYVTSSAGGTDAGGAWSHTSAAPGAAGRIYIVQLVQDGTSASNAAIDSVTNAENLAGTDNTLTYIGEFDVGSAVAASQHLWIGRSLNTSAMVITGSNAGTDDLYFIVHEFSGVSAGTTLATVIENVTAGSTVSGAGTSTTVADAGVTTLGPNRLALNFLGFNDDLTGFDGSFTSETGGDWATVISLGTSVGTDAAVNLQTATIASPGTINGGTMTITSMAWGAVGFALKPSATAAATGTITASVNEGDIVAGGKTLIITLTDEHWIASGAGSFDLQRDEIIAGVDSAQSEATGWDLVPKATQSLGGVVRTSDTVVTITWDAFPTYNITANETITVTVPGTAVVNTLGMTATPTFTISFTGSTAIKTVLGLAEASVKTFMGLTNASVKSKNGLQ